MSFDRKELLERWLAEALNGDVTSLRPASTDASFRRYWRLQHGGRSLVVMDAPPQHGGSDAFLQLAQALRSIGLNTPDVLAEHRALGFVLMSDLGSRHYLDALDADNADRLYGDAISALIRLQEAGPKHELPDYDEPFLRRELALFVEWLVDGYLRLNRSASDRVCWDHACDLLVANALEQPRVCVHRDFHSRNLMLTETANPGILDFQDAVFGPVTYDLVSLLKDCYIAWPRSRIETWAQGYFGLAVQSGILRPDHEATFLRWLDLMGAQRHLKAAGIFARLALRDAKPSYLADLPRTLGYVVDVAERYPELAPLGGFVAERVLPCLPATERENVGL